MTGQKRALTPSGGNDVVYTPDDLALKVVRHFKKQINGVVFEPCSGGGAFVRALRKIGIEPIEGDISKGLDFFDYTKKVDWIITNPPWSKARDFARHSYELADNIVFLITIIHFTALRARLKDMEQANFMIREIALVDTPPYPWPQSGFQLGAVHLQRNWSGETKFTFLR